MHTGHQALTEKEKEALRLLVSGYDAKSMARHLGLSVHTINERLRDARRKMQVSSSREAARLLRDAEGAHPQLLGDKALGAAAPPDCDHVDLHQPDHAASKRNRVWLIGGFVMSIALALYALIALTGGAPVTPADPVVASAENAAVAAAKDWLALSDSGKAAAAWDATGQAFKSLNTLDKWSAAFGKVRAPLGAMKARQLTTVNFAPAPPYGYWIIKFRTDYANKAGAIETLSLAHEDDGWKVVGITVE